MSKLNQRYGPPASEVGARIRRERERLELTQEEAAKRLGVNRLSYRQLEVAANPQLSTLVALVEAVGMDAKAVAPELFES